MAFENLFTDTQVKEEPAKAGRFEGLFEAPKQPVIKTEPIPKIESVIQQKPIEEPDKKLSFFERAKAAIKSFFEPLSRPFDPEVHIIGFPKRLSEEEKEAETEARAERFQQRYDLLVKEVPEVAPDYKEPETFFGNIKEGLLMGWEQIQPSIGYTIETIGERLNMPTLQLVGEEIGDRQMIDLMKKPELFRPEDLKPFLEGGYGDSRWYGRVIGELTPFMLSSLGFATAGGLVGGPAGAFVGGFAPSFAIETGSAYKTMIDEGIAPSDAALGSQVYGAIAALIENVFGISPAKVGTQIATQGFIKSIVVKNYKEFLIKELPKLGRKILLEALGEGGEEVAQGLSERLIRKFFNENTQLFTKDMVEEFVSGAIGSLPFGAATNVTVPKIVSPKVTTAVEPTVPEPGKPDLKKEERQKEAEKVIAEEVETKKLKEAVTGQPITIKTSYAGIKNGQDSGFRAVEEAYAQGYADLKGGEMFKYSDNTLENPFVSDGHKTTLDYLRGRYPEEVANIEKRYADRIKTQAEQEGIFAAGPEITKPVDDFIKGKLQAEGYDSLVYTRGHDAAEYQIFDITKVVAKPKEKAVKEIPQELEGLQRVNPVLFRQAQKAATVEDFIKVVYKDRAEAPPEQGVANLTEFYNRVKGEVKPKEKLKPEPKKEPEIKLTKKVKERFNREIQLIKGEVKEDPDRDPASIIFSHGFTFEDDLARLEQYAKSIGDKEFLKIYNQAFKEPIPFRPTQKEKVKKAVEVEPKAIKQIAKETKILEPNVRRILGVGTKEGTFQRVEKGVYILKQEGKEIAYIYSGDALEVLPRLAREGFKADMVFLDIPYKTPAVIGGNRGIKYDYITPEQFKTVVNSVKKIVRDQDTAVIYMYSKARSGLKAMQKYNDTMTDAGFIPLAKGDYTKYQLDGVTRVRNMRGNVIEPEGIILMNLSGNNIAKVPIDLDYHFIRPRGWQTEKPAGMLNQLIKLTTEKGDTILDPFAGSGVTVAEAVRTGRKATGIEISKKAIEEHIKPKVEKAAKIVRLEKQLNNRYKPQIEKAGRELGNIWSEMEVSAAGDRIPIVDGEGNFISWLGQKSTFPKWVDKDLRSKKLFERVMEGLKDPSNIEYPSNPRWSKQRELYNAILDELDARLGIDTADIRSQIVKEYESAKKKKITRKVKKGIERKEAIIEIKLTSRKVLPGGDIQFKYNRRLTQEEQKAEIKRLTDNGYTNITVKNRFIRGTPLKGTASATRGLFKDNTPIEMGQLDNIKPVEFPELVEIAREITGKVPSIAKMRRAAGRFYGTGRGGIKLNPIIFKKGNEGQFAKTLAHEIGHLTDYLPHRTLKRGNLLGSLLSLKRFLKNEFGGIEVKDRELRTELKAVSEYWRPYDPAVSSASFIRYRNSARELYADAISVLFNSPGTLEKMAPKFYNAFFEALDKKPEFKKAYFDLQEVLAHDRATLIELRRKRTREMFDRADYKSKELQKIREEERQFRLKDYWERFTYGVRSINQPIYDKVNQLEARGEFIPDEENPKYLLSARNYIAGQIKAEVEENVVPIIRNLEKEEIDWKSFGEFLLYERVRAGDRSEFANPGGITTKDATERTEALKMYYGEERFNVLEKSAESFRSWLKNISEEAFKEGMYTREMFDVVKGNQKYVPFQVVEHMENKVAWRTRRQIGTLKDINNPANSLILKAISTVTAIENQRNRMVTFNFLEKNFPDEIQEAKLTFTGRRQIPVETRERGMAMATYYKNGKLRGKYVDQYIAKSLERDSIGRNKAIMTILSPITYMNRKIFRPIFVIYNPGWIPFNFIRDFVRTWKNIPGLSLIRLAKRYGQAFRASKVRAFGTSKIESKAETEAVNLIRKLEKEKILSVTWNDILSGQTEEDAQIEAIFNQVGLAEQKKEIPSIYKPIEKILKRTGLISLIQGIRKTGDLIETLPKIAGYFELHKKMPPNQMAEFIRKNVGSPDFFERGFLTSATNNIFLFSNAFIQAISSDAYIATNPTTRSGFWFKTAKLTYIPKILMFAALMGAFGDELRRLYEDVSEYDMTNYFILPIGRDENNEKTIYVRIPMDETSRFLGAILWKMMRASSNDQEFGRDIADMVSLFGGQLPSLSPTISAPISALQFAAGQNPYDTFRGRLVLTKEQQEAGGLYALKPFLLWQFQQLGGNIFVKFYAGERTPTEKSKGEEFLQLPVISNIIGRFVKISDYGEIEKYRAELDKIRGEKARGRIDEDKAINKAVKEHQEKKGEFGELANDLILDVIGHAPIGKEERERAKRIRKKLQISIQRGEADPKVNSLISAQTNEEKVTLLRIYKEIMIEDKFTELVKEMLQLKIISKNVIKELSKPFQP